MQEVSKEFAESQVVTKYNKLYIALVDLVGALNVLEPGGTLLDDVTFQTRKDEKVRVSYVATPIMVTVNTDERKFILRVVEQANGETRFKPMARRVVYHDRDTEL